MSESRESTRLTRRVRVVVSGRVQGVWFRESTRRRADELGVAGWVRNLPDGSVEAHFEGDPEAVAQAIEFAGQGPPRAQVDGLSIEEQGPGEKLTGFRVR